MAHPTVVGLQEEEFDLNQLTDQLLTPEVGAACIFTGVVRRLTKRDDPRRTEYLEYQAYTSMAEEKLRQIAVEIRERWPTVIGVAIVQRTGRLLPQEPTVAVICTASHRDTGIFEAARYGIDRLKEIVPVWKKEATPEGEEWVEGDYKPQAGE